MTILDDIFFNTDSLGYLGPLGLVIVGYFVFKKSKALGVVYFMVECLFVAQYLDLVEATPAYWWQILIIMFGGILVFAFHMTDH